MRSSTSSWTTDVAVVVLVVVGGLAPESTSARPTLLFLSSVSLLSPDASEPAFGRVNVVSAV